MAFVTCRTAVPTQEWLLAPELPHAPFALLTIHAWEKQGIFSQEPLEAPGKINIPNDPNINSPNYQNKTIFQTIYKERMYNFFFSIWESILFLD